MDGRLMVFIANMSMWYLIKIFRDEKGAINHVVGSYPILFISWYGNNTTPTLSILFKKIKKQTKF